MAPTVFLPFAWRLENVPSRVTRNLPARHSALARKIVVYKRAFTIYAITERQRPMKVAIYARVSTDDKGQDPLKLLELREFASRQGWTLVREYTDEATAKNGERTGFKQMCADVAKHRFDLLLFWSLDRLTREGTYKTLTYLRRLTEAGVKFALWPGPAPPISWRWPFPAKSYTEQHIDSQADTTGSKITAGVAGTFILDV